MQTNQKIESAFDALDRELEILSKAQQQVILGGSGGSSNGGFDEIDDFINDLLDSSSEGVFTFEADVSESEKAEFKETLRSIYTANAAGEQLLRNLKWHDAKVKISGTGEEGIGHYSFGGSDYDGSNPASHTINIGGIEGGNEGAGLLAHELFHAYQDRMGKDPEHLNTELDAYIFQGMIDVMYTSTNSVLDWGRKQEGDYTAGGQVYQTTMNNTINNGYSDAKYELLQEHFINDSAVGYMYEEPIKDEDMLQVRPGPGMLGTIREFLGNTQ